MRPAMHCSSVLFPEPDSPTIATTSPANSSNDASRSAQRPAAAMAKRCDTPCTRNNGSTASAIARLALLAAPIAVGASPQALAAGHRHFVKKAVTAAAQRARMWLLWHAERVV